MIAALNVLRIVGEAADADFVAMDILPILWSMSLGPLLNLKQFQTFMELIRNLSRRVEDEQTRKLQELSGNTNGATSAANEDFMSFGGVTGTAFDSNSNGATEDDFEALVKGRPSISGVTSPSFPSWDDQPATGTSASGRRSGNNTPQAPAFSWSTPPPSNPTSPPAHKVQQQASFRTVTPDLGRFESLTPSSTQFSQPLQPTSMGSVIGSTQAQQQPMQPSSSSANWGSSTTSSTWGSTSPAANYSSFGGASQTAGSSSMSAGMTNMSLGPRPTLGASQSSSFSLAPPPPGTPVASQNKAPSSFSIAPPTQTGGWSTGGGMAQQKPMGAMGSGMGGMNNTLGGLQQQQQQQQQPASKSGLDKYQSLI
jgi:SCY1-like protein 2